MVMMSAEMNPLFDPDRQDDVDDDDIEYFDEYYFEALREKRRLDVATDFVDDDEPDYDAMMWADYDAWANMTQEEYDAVGQFEAEESIGHGPCVLPVVRSYASKKEQWSRDKNDPDAQEHRLSSRRNCGRKPKSRIRRGGVRVFIDDLFVNKSCQCESSAIVGLVNITCANCGTLIETINDRFARTFDHFDVFERYRAYSD